MAFANCTFSEILDDLSSRFIINVPEEELASVERICFQIEQAHWYYEDFVREQNPSLPSCSLKNFSAKFFRHCPLLHEWSQDYEKAFADFMQYKTRVPVCGAVMLNKDMKKCLLVKGWSSRSGWGFPKGKINKDEPDAQCAAREVLEETGFDITPLIKDTDYVEMTIREQRIRLYIVVGVPEDIDFRPQTRKEISKVEWYDLSDLPTWGKNKANAHVNVGGGCVKYGSRQYYMVVPFVNKVRQWVKSHKYLLRKERSRARANREDTEDASVLYDQSADSAPDAERTSPEDSPKLLETDEDAAAPSAGDSMAAPKPIAASANATIAALETSLDEQRRQNSLFNQLNTPYQNVPMMSSPSPPAFLITDKAKADQEHRDSLLSVLAGGPRRSSSSQPSSHTNGGGASSQQTGSNFLLSPLGAHLVIAETPQSRPQGVGFLTQNGPRQANVSIGRAPATIDLRAIANGGSPYGANHTSVPYYVNGLQSQSRVDPALSPYPIYGYPSYHSGNGQSSDFASHAQHAFYGANRLQLTDYSYGTIQSIGLAGVGKHRVTKGALEGSQSRAGSGTVSEDLDSKRENLLRLLGASSMPQRTSEASSVSKFTNGFQTLDRMPSEVDSSNALGTVVAGMPSSHIRSDLSSLSSFPADQSSERNVRTEPVNSSGDSMSGQSAQDATRPNAFPSFKFDIEKILAAM